MKARKRARSGGFSLVQVAALMSVSMLLIFTYGLLGVARLQEIREARRVALDAEAERLVGRLSQLPLGGGGPDLQCEILDRLFGSLEPPGEVTLSQLASSQPGGLYAFRRSDPTFPGWWHVVVQVGTSPTDTRIQVSYDGRPLPTIRTRSGPTRN